MQFVTNSGDCISITTTPTISLHSFKTAEEGNVGNKMARPVQFWKPIENSINQLMPLVQKVVVLVKRGWLSSSLKTISVGTGHSSNKSSAISTMGPSLGWQTRTFKRLPQPFPLKLARLLLPIKAPLMR